MYGKQIQIDFTDVNQDILMFCAFRYALGRKTYVVGAIVDILEANWGHMHPSRRSMFKKEIREAIDNDLAGAFFDVHDWERILELED